LARWRKNFSHLLNDNDVRQIEIHTSESLVSETIALEFEMAIGNPTRHKSPGTGKIPEN